MTSSCGADYIAAAVHPVVTYGWALLPKTRTRGGGGTGPGWWSRRCGWTGCTPTDESLAPDGLDLSADPA